MIFLLLALFSINNFKEILNNFNVKYKLK